jgi:hypothetical protein
MASARAPALGAVEHDLVPIDHAAGLEIGQRAPRLGLAHRDRDDHLAGAHPRHDALPERVGGEMLDRPNRADHRLEDWKGDGARDLGELLEHDQRLEVAEAESAQRLRNVDPEKAHVGVALHQLARGRDIVSLERRGDLRQLRSREAPRRLLQLALIVAEPEIHRRRCAPRPTKKSNMIVFFRGSS